jgi:hypothetical protein
MRSECYYSIVHVNGGWTEKGLETTVAQKKLQKTRTVLAVQCMLLGSCLAAKCLCLRR